MRKHIFKISDKTAKFIGNSDLYLEKNGVLLRDDYKELVTQARVSGHDDIVEELKVVMGLQNI